MRIAILGATSQIAKDWVLSHSLFGKDELVLFARRPDAVRHWVDNAGLGARYAVADFPSFSHEDGHFDAILNFVGAGDPARVIAMGASIFDVTLEYDNLALNYVKRHPGCRYLFLSSGAAYGTDFDTPPNQNTKSAIAINNVQPQEWYAIAKMHAECRHRALAHLAIVDIRVFSYFSHTQDIAGRFFMADILRALRLNDTLTVSSHNIVRDYMGPDEFHELTHSIFAARPMNDVFDCYTKAPIDKMGLLSTIKSRFGLRYEVKDVRKEVNATGLKPNYFSLNHKAGSIGYSPLKNSLDIVVDQISLAEI